MATHRTPRVVSARKLTSRSGRRAAGRFLAEGAQAVEQALRYGRVHELFVTDAARERNRELAEAAAARAVTVTTIDQRAADLLSETVTPQGVVAVCDLVDVPLESALHGNARLVAVLVGVADPGNAGTVLRVADAAGADAVVFAGDAVDPHNGKCVRASTGSLFHLPVVRHRDVPHVLEACAAAGLARTATSGTAAANLADEEALAVPRAWLFGSEAHGLPPEVLASADQRVRVPIYGRAESLNLGTAAAVCLYASAMAAHRG